MTLRFRSAVLSALFAVSILPLLSGCASVNQFAMLELAKFDFTSVSDVKLVGVPISPGADYSKLGVADVARVTAAALAKQAPIELVAHVSATNPAGNGTARMEGLDWKFFVKDHQAFAGKLAEPIELAPGKATDVPLAVNFDAVKLGASGARDLYDLAVGIAGQGQVTEDVRLELLPSIKTPAGTMAFPAPIVVHRLGAK